MKAWLPNVVAWTPCAVSITCILCCLQWFATTPPKSLDPAIKTNGNQPAPRIPQTPLTEARQNGGLRTRTGLILLGSRSSSELTRTGRSGRRAWSSSRPRAGARRRRAGAAARSRQRRGSGCPQHLPSLSLIILTDSSGRQQEGNPATFFTFPSPHSMLTADNDKPKHASRS